MYNEVEYELIPLELPNIVWAVDRRFPSATPPTETCPFMLPLITKLAKARPKWTLVGINHRVGNNGARQVTEFHVMEGNDVLGRIQREYNYGTSNYVYSITNERIDAKRQRGSSIRTKDVTKAFKVITKEFHGKTADEQLADARKTASAVVINNMNAHRYKFHKLTTDVQPKALAFAEDRLNEFRSFVGGTLVDEFLEARQMYDYAEDMWTHQNAGTGIVVAIRGDEYIMSKGTEVRLVTSAQLTPHQRRAIGMLKLADVNTFIPGIGIKGSDSVVFIMPEEEEKGDV